MKIRVISLLLAIVLTLLLLPIHTMKASAAATTSEEIVEQIRQIYRRSRRSFGGSFNGYCGSLVSYQTYYMGIDKSCHPRDGNKQYDQYCNVGVTCGGYRVKAYSANQYTMKEAFNAITHNGTLDVYNLLVGFHWTHTAAGSKYGHALLIHAVIDGMVYFVECYDASIGGKYYPEGEPIVCSVDTFCNYYGLWTRFEGIIEFGLKNYADACTYYPMTFTGMVKESAELLFEPMDAAGGEKDVEQTFRAGDKVDVIGLYETPAGELWYEIETPKGSGYMIASAVAAMTAQEDNLTISGLKVPNSLYKGKSFSLDGTISGGKLQNVQVQVFHTADESAPVLQSTHTVNGNSFRLNDAALDRAMAFRKLPVGSYRIEISADVATYSLTDGSVVESVENRKLWVSLFDIVSNRNTYHTVTFQPGDGEVSISRKPVCAGTAVGELPVPHRDGSVFGGWTLDPEGMNPVSEEMVISGNVTLYAQWIQALSGFTGWKQVDKQWIYYQMGSPVNGAFTFDGLHLYQNRDGSPGTGWILLDNSLKLFNENGVRQTGWYQNENRIYYLHEDGAKAVGWTTIDEGAYLFDSEGRLQLGWISKNSEKMYLFENGTRATGWVEIDGSRYLFDADGILQLMVDGAPETSLKEKTYCVFNREMAQKYSAGNHIVMLG